MCFLPGCGLIMSNLNFPSNVSFNGSIFNVVDVINDTFVIHIMRLIGVKHRKWNLALILFIGLANVGRPCPCIVALEVCTTFTIWFDGGWGYWTVTIFVLTYAIMWLYRCFLYRFKQIASYMWGFSINSHLFIFFHIGLLVVKTLLPHQTILIKPPYLTFRTYPSGLASI